MQATNAPQLAHSTAAAATTANPTASAATIVARTRASVALWAAPPVGSSLPTQELAQAFSVVRMLAEEQHHVAGLRGDSGRVVRLRRSIAAGA